MSAPPISPQPGSSTAESPAADQTVVSTAVAATAVAATAVAATAVAATAVAATALAATPDGSSTRSFAATPQALGAWIFGAIMLVLLVIFLYFPPKVPTVTGFCIEAVITAIFAGLFGYFLIGATNQNWTWRITPNLSVNIQATGGFALSIGVIALFLGMYYSNANSRTRIRPMVKNHASANAAATGTNAGAPAGTSSSMPAGAPASTASAPAVLSAVVVSTTVDEPGNLELNVREKKFEQLGFKPGDSVRVTILGKQYTVHYIKTAKAKDVPNGQDYVYIDSLRTVALATGGESFAQQHGVKAGDAVKIQKLP